jgi:hypothetical protein
MIFEGLLDFLVRDSPSVEPLHVAVLLVWSHHTPRDGHEEDVEPNCSCVQNAVQHILDDLGLGFQNPIYHESEIQDCKIKCWVIVMYIGNTSHGHKRKVVKEPSENWVESGVMNLVNIGLFEFGVTSLPADQVPHNHKSGNAESSGRSPVDQWVSKKEVLHDRVIPTTHAKTDIKNWPLPELRREIILLIWVRNESVVRRHHRNIEMNEIL